MRILYHHRTLGDGAEGIHIAEMVNAFRQLGHEVKVIGPSIQHIEGIEQNTKRYLWIKKIFRGPFYELAELGYNFVGYWNVCRAIKEFKPDFIYDRYIIFNYSVVAAGQKNNIPVFLEVNAPLALERDHEKDEYLYFKKLAYFLEKSICCTAFRAIVVSTPLKNYLIKQGVPSSKLICLPNGVNTDTFTPVQKDKKILQKYCLNENDIIVGFVGILRPWHGLDILLQAISDIINQERLRCKLLIVGDGPIRGELEHKIKDLSLAGKVIITGRVPHNEINNYIGLFDIAISPKTTFYASPMKIIEYMAMAKPVVAPDIENIRDIIKNQETGLLFENGNPVSLAEAIKVLVSDESMRSSLGMNAFKHVKSVLNWKTNAKKIIDIFTREVKLNQ